MRVKRMILAVFLVSSFFVLADSSGAPPEQSAVDELISEIKAEAPLRRKQTLPIQTEAIKHKTISHELQLEINRVRPAPEEVMTETLDITPVTGAGTAKARATAVITPVLPAATTDLLAQELQTEIQADAAPRKQHKAKVKEVAYKTKLTKHEKILKQKLKTRQKIAVKQLSAKLAAQKQRQQKELQEQKLKSNFKLTKLKQHNKMQVALAKAKVKAMSAKAHEKTLKATAKVKSDMQLKLRMAKAAAAKKAATAARAAAVLRRKQALLRLKTRMAKEGSAKKAKTAREKAHKHGSIAQLKAKLDKATSALRARLRKQPNHTAGVSHLKRMQRRSVRKVRRMARAARRMAKRKSRRLKRNMRRMQDNADAAVRKRGRAETRALGNWQNLRKLGTRKQAVHNDPPTTVILAVNADRQSNTRPGARTKSAAKKFSSKSHIGKRVHGELQRVVQESELEKARTRASVHALKQQKRALRAYQRVERGHYKKPHIKPFVMPKLKKFTVPKHALPKSVRKAYQKLKKREEEVSREELALLSPFTVSYDRQIVGGIDHKADELQKEIDDDIDNIENVSVKTPSTAHTATLPLRLQAQQVKSSHPRSKHSGVGRISAAGLGLPFLLVLATAASVVRQ